MPKVQFKIDPEKEYVYHVLFREHWENHTIFAFQKDFTKERILRKINDFWDEKDRQMVEIMRR